MRIMTPGFARSAETRRGGYFKTSRPVKGSKGTSATRARKGVSQVANLVGTSGDTHPRGHRLLNTHQLFDVYWRTPDIRAPMDSIARRVAGQQFLVEPTGLPPDNERLAARAQAEADRIAKFFRRPDGYNTWYEWCFQFVLDALVYGAGAAEKVHGTRTKRIKELALLRGDDIELVIDKHGKPLRYDQWNSGQHQAAFELDGIVYLNLFPSTYQPRPIPIIESCVNEVVTLLCSSERAMIALDADEIPPGLLVLSNIVGESLEMFQKDMQSFRGRDNRLRVIHSEEGDAKWLRLDRDFKDVEFIDVVKEVRDRVWRLLGVTKADMGDVADANRANMEAQLEAGQSHLIKPILMLIGEKMTTDVFPALVQDAEVLPYLTWAWDFDDSLSPEEEKALSDALSRYVGSGIMTRDEARVRLGLPEMGGVASLLATDTHAGPAAVETEDTDEPDPGDDVASPEGGDEPDLAGRGMESRATENRATDFPNEGDDKAIRLENSEHPRFDYEFMLGVKEDHPDVWDLGGNDSPEKEWSGDRAFRMWGKARAGDYTDTVEEWVKTREAWVPRHFKNHRIAGVIAQGKWAAVGTLGEGGMKDLIREEIDKREDRATWLPGLLTHTAVFDRGYWPALDRVQQTAEEQRATGLETEDLPSDWQAGSRFDKYRTVNVSDLGRAVVGYRRDVTPLYREARETVESVIRANYEGDTLPQAAVGRVVRRVDEALDKLVMQWSMATEQRYLQAVQVADDAAERHFMVSPEEARAYASKYQRAAMGYLVSEPGLIYTLRSKLYGFVSAVARGGELPDMAARGDDCDPGCGCGVHPPDEAEHRTLIDNPAEIEGLAEALSAVGALFDAQEHRIDNWSGKLVECCFDRLNSQVKSTSVEWYAEWVAVGDGATCPDCMEFATRGFRPLETFETVPGGATQCGARCRCVLVYWTRDEVKSGEAESLTLYDA